MKKIIITSLALTLLAGPVWAAGGNLSTDSDSSNRTESDKTSTTKKSEETKNSKGSKSATTNNKGVDITSQESSKTSSQGSKGNTLDLSLDLQSLFSESIVRLEQSGHPFFSSKRILSNPKLPADFGLTAIIKPGVIDSIRAKAMGEMAASGASVSSMGDEEMMRRYKNDLASYGAVVGQAYLYLQEDLANLATGKKDKKGAVAISSIGYLDLLDLADAALVRASEGITDTRTSRLLDRIQRDGTPCRFAGSTNEIQCGGVLVGLGARPELTAYGVPMYGKAFAGYTGSYKVSSGWSYSAAVESLKSSNVYAKFGEEVSNYTEELKSKGRGKEAVQTKKKAMGEVASGKRGLSLSGLLPGIH
jgi:hypothetical protein